MLLVKDLHVCSFCMESSGHPGFQSLVSSVLVVIYQFASDRQAIRIWISVPGSKELEGPLRAQNPAAFLYLRSSFRGLMARIVKIQRGNEMEHPSWECYNASLPQPHQHPNRPQMARNLQTWQRKLIVHMTLSRKRLTISQMAKVAKCSERSVTNIRRNMRLFDDPRSPSVPAGQPSIITPVMVDTLCNHLAEKPGLYVEEMALFLWEEFRVLPSSSSVKRALARAGWTKKKAQQKAKEQNPQLRDFYQHKLSEFRSYHLVFIDESGCDQQVGNRRTGWSPLGVTPAQISKFHRGQRYQILPAYAQDGVILSRIFKGSTDARFFESFIEQLLQHCGRWPEPKSVLVMDNASFHRSDRMRQLCSEAGVKLLYLPPYSPDFNPIEEFFAELKAYIKKVWSAYEKNPDQGFHTFLRQCVNDVGAKQQSAKGHFRHAGINVEEA
ncbi:hypothetical protein N7456_007075 [Penicillium angulare]|uniref:Tc1-like transposase DDE domain-containing protein n=1 Tax=Penicillium angulare TaxID=116970 RepID=A0A9W9KCL3_9EURO|nr:hypothetical protein N7456_007075 [Penicillium angulare]